MRADNPLDVRIRRHLATLQARALWRVMRPPSGVDLSSNDYLNLATHPRVKAAFVAGIERDGCGSTGSRLLRGDRQSFADVELAFARFKETPRALFFSSGYLANLAVLTTLPESGDLIVSDERNHASLIDGGRLSRASVVDVPHNDVDAVARALDGTPCRGVRFVVVESRYSMDGDMPDLLAYAAVCQARGALLIVDEAHAVGVDGARGSGLVEASGMDPGSCVSINTAGKALGVAGAFVAGPASVIEFLVQRARSFVFSTAAPPAVADAIQAGLDVVQDEPARRALLQTRSRGLRRRLRASGLDVDDSTSQIVPIRVGGNARALAIAQALQDAGFDVRAIRPPSVPPGTARLRLSVNAGLSEDTLDRLVTELGRALSLTQDLAHRPTPLEA